MDKIRPALQRGAPTGLSPVHARMEFNPSRFLDHGVYPLSGVLALTLAVLEDVQTTFVPLKVPDETVVERIDLTRDFTVSEPEHWLRALVGLRPAYSRHQFAYYGTDASLDSVVSGSRTRRITFYDRARQAPGEWTSLHNLRWEAQVKTAREVARLGIGTPDQRTEERLLAAMVRRRSSWDWVSPLDGCPSLRR